jgi:hypothetical protein
LFHGPEAYERGFRFARSGRLQPPFV